MGRTVPRFACFDRKERHIRNSPVLPKPRFAPCASLAPREGRPLRVAVSAAYGVSPPCRARGEGTRTDSQRLATRRHVPKGAFRGTRAPSADVTCRAKSRVAVSSRCGAQPQRYPSAQRGGADSHSGAVGLGEPSQGGDAIQLVSFLKSWLRTFSQITGWPRAWVQPGAKPARCKMSCAFAHVRCTARVPPSPRTVHRWPTGIG